MKHPIGNKRLVERNNIELLIRHEFLGEPRRLNAKGIVAHESDDELTALSLRIIPIHLAPRHVTERTLDALIIVGVAFRMTGKGEQLPLAAFSRDHGRVARLGGVRVALRVVISVIRRQNLRARPLDLVLRADRNGAAAILDSVDSLLYPGKLLSLFVERKI